MADSILKTSAGLITQVDACGVIKDVSGGASTTLDAGEPAGETSISVADETGFLADDYVRIGSGDTLEVGQVASTSAGTIVLKTGLRYAQANGVALVEQEKIDMGHVGEAGLDIGVSEDIFEAGAATSPKVLVRKTTRITQNFVWPAMEWTASMIAHAFGIPQASVLGSGTAADPYVIALDGDAIKSVTNVSLYAECTREDADIVEFQGWNLTPDLNKSWNVSRNSTAELPFGGDVKTIAMIRYTPS